MSNYPNLDKGQAPPAYAPGYQNGYQDPPQNQTTVPIQQPVQPIIQQPHYQQPVVFHTAPNPIHRFYGCCDAKIGWSIIYGIVLACKIISLIVAADNFYGNEDINIGPLIETIILTICIVSMFIAMFRTIPVCFYPIIAYNGLTAIILSIQALGCTLYVVGAQNFGIKILEGMSYINQVPFMPEPWDTDNDIDFDGEHVVGAASWLGMLFIGIGYLIGAVVYAVLAKGLNDYRKWMAALNQSL